MKKILILFMLISMLAMGAEKFKVEEVKRKGKPFGMVVRNEKGEIVKEYRYKTFTKDGKPSKMDVIERGKRAKKTGELTFVYNKGKKMLSIEKDLDDNVRRVSYFFEKGDSTLEEVRDGNGMFIKYLEHKKNSLTDVTNEMIEERWINKMVIKEDELLQVIKPLDSLELILKRDDRMVLTNSLINFSTDKSREKDTLIAELVTDGIREYINSDLVIYTGGKLDGKITIGNIRYADIKSIVKDEKLYLFRVWGETLIEIFEHAAKLPTGHREFPNTSGMVWDTTGDKINLEIQGKAIDKFKKYSVVVNDYIKEGNGIYYPFKTLKSFEVRYPASIIVAEYLRKIQIIDRSYLVEKRYKK